MRIRANRERPVDFRAAGIGPQGVRDRQRNAIHNPNTDCLGDRSQN